VSDGCARVHVDGFTFLSFAFIFGLVCSCWSPYNHFFSLQSLSCALYADRNRKKWSVLGLSREKQLSHPGTSQSEKVLVDYHDSTEEYEVSVCVCVCVRVCVQTCVLVYMRGLVGLGAGETHALT
jgi:hypothetical protein